jgi:hypothetical protein
MAFQKTLTKEWTKFNGDYEKLMQDIKLFNGDIITKCWPNSGYWFICQKKSNEKYFGKGQIKVGEVEYVRQTHYIKW